MWVRHATYMFAYHGINVTLIYEPPMSAASMSFMPTPFNSPEVVLAQLQNLRQSSMFVQSVSLLNRTVFRTMHYARQLPGLCFCCHASNPAFGKWRSGLLEGGSICGNWLIADPNLWFFWGGGVATNYHPGNYQCATIGYLTLPVQVLAPVSPTPGAPYVHRRRAALGPECSDEVIVDPGLSKGSSWGRAIISAITGVLTVGSYPGITAQENCASIIGLTCRLEKTINATTELVRDLQMEVQSLHQVSLQHRFALDYLLA
ncbi:UNVERIFIED_CONTAM: hypothetical protein K2H54_047111 [Gekko kuhli]